MAISNIPILSKINFRTSRLLRNCICSSSWWKWI